MNLFKGAIYLSLTSAIWGGVYVVSKVILGHIRPWLLLELRFMIGLLLLGGIAWRYRVWKIEQRDLLLLAGVGLIGCTGSIGLQFVGTDLSSAAMGSLITSASPALISIFAFYLLKERLSYHKITSLLLATIGVIFVIGIPGREAHGETIFMGNVILFGAAITWALYTVLSRVLTRKYSSLTVATWATLFGVIFTLPITVWEQATYLEPIPTDLWIWIGVIYLGTISTAGAMYLWNKGFEYVDAATGSLFFFIQPLVGSLLGWLLLGEQLSWNFFGGAILILLGVYIATRINTKG